MINPRLLICKYNTLPNRKLSKNGAVKRVMFDGGYATFSEGGVCPDGTTSCATMRGVCAW